MRGRKSLPKVKNFACERISPIHSTKRNINSRSLFLNDHGHPNNNLHTNITLTSPHIAHTPHRTLIKMNAGVAGAAQALAHPLLISNVDGAVLKYYEMAMVQRIMVSPEKRGQRLTGKPELCRRLLVLFELALQCPSISPEDGVALLTQGTLFIASTKQRPWSVTIAMFQRAMFEMITRFLPQDKKSILPFLQLFPANLSVCIMCSEFVSSDVAVRCCCGSSLLCHQCFPSLTGPVVSCADFGELILTSSNKGVRATVLFAYKHQDIWPAFSTRCVAFNAEAPPGSWRCEGCGQLETLYPDVDVNRLLRRSHRANCFFAHRLNLSNPGDGLLEYFLIECYQRVPRCEVCARRMRFYHLGSIDPSARTWSCICNAQHAYCSSCAAFTTCCSSTPYSCSSCQQHTTLSAMHSLIGPSLNVLDTLSLQIKREVIQRCFNNREEMDQLEFHLNRGMLPL